eukprot:COSAG02_NODE_2_length_75708_cov_87.013953_60_plen_134_part_00
MSSPACLEHSRNGWKWARRQRVYSRGEAVNVLCSHNFLLLVHMLVSACESTSENEEPTASDNEFIDDSDVESDHPDSYASGSETEDLLSEEELTDIDANNVVSCKRARRQTEFYVDSDAEELMAESDDDGTQG